MVEDTANALADMEELYPAWDLDINRHMVLEIARHRARSGPLWALTMFPFERMWKRLIDWMKQVVHPEATMIRSYRAYRAALDFMAQFGHLLDDGDTGNNVYYLIFALSCMASSYLPTQPSMSCLSCPFISSDTNNVCDLICCSMSLHLIAGYDSDDQAEDDNTTTTPGPRHSLNLVHVIKAFDKGHASDSLLLPSYMHKKDELSGGTRLYKARHREVQVTLRINHQPDTARCKADRRLFVELHKYYLQQGVHEAYRSLWSKYISR
jgi:hypothetical protein